MTDIILIGSGKAGSLHCKCHSKLKELNINIAALIDSNPHRLKRFPSLYKKFNEGESPFAAGSLEEVSKQMDMEDTILDLCVPNDVHYQCAKEACDLGAKKMIEKPIVNSVTDAKKIEKLSASISIAEKIEKYNLKPKFVRTEFSKDRRSDTANGGGILKKGAPHIFTVEVPHQLAIANYLFGIPVDSFEHGVRIWP